jgi:hypothetical protein
MEGGFKIMGGRDIFGFPYNSKGIGGDDYLRTSDLLGIPSSGAAKEEAQKWVVPASIVVAAWGISSALSLGTTGDAVGGEVGSAANASVAGGSTEATLLPTIGVGTTTIGIDKTAASVMAASYGTGNENDVPGLDILDKITSLSGAIKNTVSAVTTPTNNGTVTVPEKNNTTNYMVLAGLLLAAGLGTMWILRAK